MCSAEAAGEHLAGLLRSANATGSVNGHGAALPSLLQLDQVPLVSRVHSAFHVRLADKVPVPKKTFLELRKYQLVCNLVVSGGFRCYIAVYFCHAS